LTAKIDRRRKMPATVLLRALGYESDEQILDLYKDVLGRDEQDLLKNTLEKDSTKTQSEALLEIYEKMKNF